MIYHGGESSVIGTYIIQKPIIIMIIITIGTLIIVIIINSNRLGHCYIHASYML